MNATLFRAACRRSRAILFSGNATRLRLRSLVVSLAPIFFPAAAGGTEFEVDRASGLVIAPGYEQVKAQCTVCHSGRLVTQNRADREGWRQMIRWMQETQNLWPLGPAEEEILDYLAGNYGPLPGGRRAPLEVSFE